MDKFSFKYYPAPILVFLICLIIAIKFGLHETGNIIFKKDSRSLIADLVYILLSAATVISLMRLVNQKGMWKWLLKLLGLCDIRGTYKGIVTSSYHEDDDPSKPNIKLYCAMNVAQNLNGLYVQGYFFTDKKMTKRSSGFISRFEEIKKLPHGVFHIHYFFSHTGDQLHPDHKKYGLNNHDGVCIFTYDPHTQQMEGYYFNRERTSHGKMTLVRAS